MAEPWASYDSDLAQTSVWLAADGHRAEREARRQERQREAERAERADRREATLFAAGKQWADALGHPFDPLNPYQYIPSPQARAEMIEAAEIAKMRREAKDLLREAGLPVSLLAQADLPEQPPGVPVLPEPEPTTEELADAELARARQRTSRAGLLAKIRAFRRRAREGAVAATRAATPLDRLDGNGELIHEPREVTRYMQTEVRVR